MLRKGFTLIELIVVMGVIAILFGFSTISLLSTQHRASVNSATSQLISDLRQQQLDSMSGYKGSGAVGEAFGVHLESDKYTLFTGPHFFGDNIGNLAINLESSLEIADPTTIVFSTGSGELWNATAPITVTVRNKVDGISKAITINRYGVVTGVD